MEAHCNGGSLQRNWAGNGGGIYVASTTGESKVIIKKAVNDKGETTVGVVKDNMSDNGVYGSFVATGGTVTTGTADTGARSIYVVKSCTVVLSGNAKLAQITFAANSSKVLTVDGNYSGRAELQYPGSADLTEGTVLGTISPAGDLSRAELTIADVCCKSLLSHEGVLVIGDDHQWETVTLDPTCTADGSVTETCRGCSDVKTAILPAAGHTYESIMLDATCTDDGTLTETCVACGDVKITTIPAAGHRYQNKTVGATCTEDGSITITCTACGDTKFAIIAATGHSYVDGICGVCGEAVTLTMSSPL